MSRYAIFVGDHELEGQNLHGGATTVHEAEPDAPKKTGLLDAQGRPLYRLPEEKQPIGYVRKFRKT